MLSSFLTSLQIVLEPGQCGNPYTPAIQSIRNVQRVNVKQITNFLQSVKWQHEPWCCPPTEIKFFMGGLGHLCAIARLKKKKQHVTQCSPLEWVSVVGWSSLYWGILVKDKILTKTDPLERNRRHCNHLAVFRLVTESYTLPRWHRSCSRRSLCMCPDEVSKVPSGV